MVGIVVVIGLLKIGLYLAILSAPQLLRRIIDFFLVGSRIYLAGLLNTILGALLLISAARVRTWSHVMAWGYVIAVALLLAATGLCVYFFALRRTKKIFARLQKQSNLILRLCALSALALWVILLYAFPVHPVQFVLPD